MNLKNIKEGSRPLKHCLQIIVQHIEPNPVTYTRLAGVSRDFYEVFTSDLTWRYLNPYGWESGIYSRFLKKCESKLPLMRKYWSDKRTAKNSKSKRAMEAKGPPAGSSYLELGFLIYTILGPNIEGEFQHNYSITSRQMLWCAVHISPYAFELAGSDLTNDSEIVEYVVKRTGDVFWNIGADLQNDNSVVWDSIKHRTVVRFPGICESVDPALAIVPERFRKSRKYVLEAVKYNRESLQYASPELRADKQVVLTAIAADRAMPTELEDGTFSRRIHPRSTPLILQWVSEELRDDTEVVLAAVKQDGLELMHASDRLKDDLEIVLAAVNRNQDAYNHSSLRIQVLPEVIQAFHHHHHHNRRKRQRLS